MVALFFKLGQKAHLIKKGMTGKKETVATHPSVDRITIDATLSRQIASIIYSDSQHNL